MSPAGVCNARRQVVDASRTRWSLSLVAAVCSSLILALSACGGGGGGLVGGSTTVTLPATALTAAQFRQKANAICLSLYRKKIPKGLAGLTAILVDGRAADSSLEALRPPASLATLDARLIQIEKAGAAYVATLVKEEKAGRKFTALSILSPRFVQLGGEEDRLWRKLGVDVCANGPLARYTR